MKRYPLLTIGFGLIMYLIMSYLGLWALAWAMYYCKKYGFLPWP